MNKDINLIKDALKKYRCIKTICPSTIPSNNNSIIIVNLCIIIQAINTIRLVPEYGETYYKIIYYNYLSPEVYYNTYEIIDALKRDGIYLSHRTYFRKKQQALKLISEILQASK